MDLWPGYKTGEGIEPDLLAQFPLLEEALSAAGVVVWPMVRVRGGRCARCRGGGGGSRCACRTRDHLHAG